MKKALLLGLGILGVLLLALVGVVAMQPAAFRIERSATMTAPAEKVFAQVNDFHLWQAWSPWAKRDPQATNSYGGADSGEGAIFKWSGNNEVGEGQMTIVESKPNERIRIQLDFQRPMKATNVAEFTFQPQSDQTLVTWSMTGENNFVGKAFHLIMDVDKMVGGDFEQGLANLKGVVETGATP